LAAGLSGSRRTAVRITFGAICLSSSSLCAKLYSYIGKGHVAAGPGEVIDETSCTGPRRQTQRQGAVETQQRFHAEYQSEGNTGVVASS
jgi:hypothetical protein